tara:strand:+ start:7578 stop:9221 length:1644 start_codon:yes stop_codon:yes gene_type:complete
MPGKEVYLNYALDQIPRILGNMDRNSFSPTYGCFHRDYWLDKTSDFPDAVRQFGSQALAIVYSTEMPNNLYFNQQKILDWAIASMEFWSEIQHKDGSFDEFYPNERGWVGPTAFTTFSIIESFNLLKEKIPLKASVKIKDSIKKAAYFISKGDNEEDHLANHHAMACLAVWKAYKLLGDEVLLNSYNKLWNGFLEYHIEEEGWSMEYDGIDPGYLSATVSFLGKIYQDNKDEKIKEVCLASIETCSYFSYPNGFYAGSLGSRNTLHFYPHGFEIFGESSLLSQEVADNMLLGLSEGKLVPPSIMSDRYVFYRIPEFLQSYKDFSTRREKKNSLPFENQNLYKYFEKAKIWILSNQEKYCVVNAAKGGVVKVFNKYNNELDLNDCGIIGKLNSGKMITSQWIDEGYTISQDNNSCNIKGRLNLVPSNKYFNIPKQVLFRSFLFLLGWYPPIAHSLKGWIRKILMLGSRPIDIWFDRKIYLKKNEIIVEDKIKNLSKFNLLKLSIGDEFFVRYVPQSRYFQTQELGTKGRTLSKEKINEINRKEDWVNL